MKKAQLIERYNMLADANAEYHRQVKEYEERFEVVRKGLFAILDLIDAPFSEKKIICNRPKRRVP